MNPEDYAWNAHERQLYETGQLQLPSVSKVKILDDSQLRLELERLLVDLSQRDLAAWALAQAEDFLPLIDIGDEERQEVVISQVKTVFSDRLEGRASAHDLRQAGFLANKLAQDSLTEISRYAARVFAQAVATAHMRGHAMVSADYAVKIRNLQHPGDLEAASKERKRQMEVLRKILYK